MLLYISGSLLFVGILGIAVSVELSVRYYKRNDPERFSSGLMPIPDGKTVPKWVSFLNTYSWLLIGLAIMVASFDLLGLNPLLALSTWAGYAILKTSKICTLLYYSKSVYAKAGVPPDPRDMKTIPLWVTGLFFMGWASIIVPWVVYIVFLVMRN